MMGKGVSILLTRLLTRCDVLFIHVDVCTTTIRIYTSVDDYRILSLTRSLIHTLFHVIFV
jgi:hypothetical protein